MSRVLAIVACLALALCSRFAFAGPDAGTAVPSRDAGAALPSAVSDAGSVADAAATPAAATLSEEPLAPTGPRLPLSEVERATGQPVVRIQVAGNRRVALEDMLTYLKLKVGQPFKPEALASDVRALWDSGFFADIEVDMTRTDLGVALRFLVRERPSIAALEFSGNEEIDNEKLTEAVDLKVNTSLNVPSVRRAVQKIKDAYAEKGYYLAEVEYALQDEKDNEVTVQFKVKENQSVSVRRVNFVGNLEVSDRELREMMTTGQSSLFSFGSGGPYKQDILERDILMISGLYYDKGFLNVQVGTPRIMLTPDREGIEITLVIHEGPRFKIRQLQIVERDADGKEVEPLGGRRALRQMLRATSGDFFNRAELVKDITAIRTLYRDAGYANVEAEPESIPDPKTKEIDLIIPIRRGALVRIERIEVKGNTKTRDKVLRREFEAEEGQLFSETRLEESRRRVMALGYFERVEMSTEQGSAPDRIVVRFEITEKPTGTFQVGAGFSSVEQFIITAQVQQQNLFGNGQQLSLQLQGSSLRQLINIRLFEPYLFDSDWSGSVDLYRQQYVYPDFSRTTTGGSLNFGYALIQPWLRLSLAATTQWDQVDNSTPLLGFGSNSNTLFTAFSRLPLANLFNNGRTFSLRPAITYDNRDNRIFPTSGFFFQASTEYANKILGSEIEFLRHTLNVKFYIPLGGQTPQPGSGFVLKNNSNFGVITSPNPQGVPIFQRYFLGGILDMRGYRLRTVGPRLPLSSGLDINAAPNAAGSNFGGNMQFYNSTEFEFPVLDKVGVRGVGFLDFGNAWNLEEQFCRNTPAPQFPRIVSPCYSGLSSLTSLRAAAGAGIRWFSPLGPLRFEWGFPLNKQAYEESSVFEFTIGNSF
jgi:outer membrane protein insertion porin family